MPTSWLDLLHCGWTPSPPTGLTAPVSGVDSPVRGSTPTACQLLSPTNSLLASRYLFRSRRDFKSKNPLSGFAPKQTKESSAWRATYIVLHQFQSTWWISRKWFHQNIRKLIKDEEFINSVNDLELRTWISFVDVQKVFLGNRQTESYKEKLLKSPLDISANMSIKVHFFTSPSRWIYE